MPLTWTSRKQQAAALSTAEVNYGAMTDVIQCAIYVQQLGRTFDRTPKGITIKNDKMAAFTMTKALGATKRSKFIEMRHQYIKQTIQDKKSKHTSENAKSRLSSQNHWKEECMKR